MNFLKAIILISGFITLVSANVIKSQSFNGETGLINNTGILVTFGVNVSGLPAQTSDEYGLESLTLNINHHWVSKLDIKLMAPDSTFIDVCFGVGRQDTNFTNTSFSNHSLVSIFETIPPYNGTFLPIGDPGIFNAGLNPNGMWKLLIRDTYPNYSQGELLSWAVTFSPRPSMPREFFSSDIPIVIINTHKQLIPDDPKIYASMGIIDNGSGSLNHITDPVNHYNGWIGIEQRGSSARIFPKKSYGFETWNSSGEETDYPLLGMPEESDWILNAFFNDKSLIRSMMAGYIWHSAGHYASRGRFCQLVLNQQYYGVYLLMEKIKRDQNRVDISKLLPEDSTGTELTGGYIIKIDKTTGSGGEGWDSPFPPASGSTGKKITFLYEYPEAEQITAPQKSYIQNYMGEFENALYYYNTNTREHYGEYIDIESFIDFFIVNEASRNVDGYRLSTFLHKGKNGKLVMGPVWDYDLAWRNADYCEAFEVGGWAYQFGNVCPDDPKQVPFWWEKLMSDSNFINQVKCRWVQLRQGVLNEQNLFSYMDSLNNILNISQAQNFGQWPVFGRYIWPIPEPWSQDYSEEITNMKTWISKRFQWLDENLPGVCNNSGLHDFQNLDFKIFPNPASDHIWIESLFSDPEQISINLSDVFGKNYISQKYLNAKESDARQLNLDKLDPGLYFLKIKTSQVNKTYKIVLN